MLGERSVCELLQGGSDDFARAGLLNDGYDPNRRRIRLREFVFHLKITAKRFALLQLADFCDFQNDSDMS